MEKKGKINMKRSYNFEWYENIKFGEPIVRCTVVQLTNPIGKTEIDAKNATDIFLRRVGGLKKNTIIRIKEFGENGQIGEDIVPSEGSKIMPIAKK